MGARRPGYTYTFTYKCFPNQHKIVSFPELLEYTDNRHPFETMEERLTDIR